MKKNSINIVDRGLMCIMRSFSLLMLMLILGFGISAQDLHFSQFYRAPLLYNPASAGDMERAGRASVLYRSQWQNVENGYESYYFAADAQLKPEWLNADNLPAIGAMVHKDIGGEFKYGHVVGSIFLADHLMMSQNQKLSFGIRGGVGKSTMELAGWQWGNQYDGDKYNSSLPGENPFFIPKTFADFAAGIQYAWGLNATTMSSGDQQSLRVGLSASHLTRSRENTVEGSNARQHIRYTATAYSYIGQRNNSIALQPSGYFSLQGGAREFVVGTNVLYRMKESSKYTNLVESNGIGFGVFMRWGDALMPSIYYESEKIQLGVSYDVNISGFRRATSGNGGFEISFRYGIRSLSGEV